MILTCPSKTFCVGEYAVLKHFQAIIILTEPVFQLTVQSKPGSFPHEPHLISLEEQWPSDHSWEWHDPHHKKGGLGASSAQFLLTQTALDHMNNTPRTLNETLQIYRNCHTTKTPPSGADVVGQYNGWLTFVDTQHCRIHTYSWPFDDLGFVIIRTGKKCATHQELNTQTIPQLDDAHTWVEHTHAAIKDKSSKAFIQGIKNFHKTMVKHKLCHSETQELLQSLSHESILAAKGCGAQGRDTCLLITERSAHLKIKRWLANRVEIIADHTQLSAGLVDKRINNE
jgi:mevalonate kinase